MHSTNVAGRRVPRGFWRSALLFAAYGSLSVIIFASALHTGFLHYVKARPADLIYGRGDKPFGYKALRSAQTSGLVPCFSAARRSMAPGTTPAYGRKRFFCH